MADSSDSPLIPKLGRLFGPVLAQRSLLARSLGVLFLGAMLQLLFPKGAELLVDGTLEYGHPALQDINQICLGLLGIVALVLGLRYLESCWFLELGERATTALREEVFARLIRLPMKWFAEQRSGDLTSRMLADLAQLQELWIFDMRMILTFSAIMFGALVMLFITSWQLAVGILLIAPIVILLARSIGPLIRRQATRTQEKLAAAAVQLEEAVRSMVVVKSSVSEQEEISRFRGHMDEYLKPALKGGRARAMFISSIVFCLLVTWVYMMWRGSWLVRELKMTPGEFTSFMFFLGFAGTASGVVAEHFAKFQRALSAYDRISEILSEVPEELESLPVPACPRLQGRLEFSNVEFHYPSRPGRKALRGVSFVANPGECIALVGPSGAGKSTVASLICRLYEEQSGMVSFDGLRAQDYPLGWLRGQVTCVPQEILLFSGSVADNIRYGSSTATMEEIKDAARKAHAWEFIDKLPQGLQTSVGDRGLQLSGGQRQRIALARAILRNPAVLVLDEATSALDTESEALIQAALEVIMKGRTTFVIAHRLSTVRRADRILVMNDGVIVESGTHDELHAAKGAYWHLCEQQFAN